MRFDLFFNPPGHPEKHQRQEEYKADDTAKEAMSPLPPEDKFEFSEAHALIDLGVFGNQLIFGESIQPIGGGKRRNDA